MTITIVNRQKKISLNPAPIQRRVKKILEREGVRQANLSLVFVTDRIIRQLNRRFLKKDRSTDVLAFDLNERGLPRSTLKGEIIISAERALVNSRRFNHPIEREILLYVIHGILHLRGYEDHSPGEIKRMRHREQEHLQALWR